MKPKNHDQPDLNIENSHNPVAIFCSAVSNIMAWVKGNEGLQLWPKFSLNALVACFKGAKKENFLTEKPLAATLQMINKEGNVRRVIPRGTRITLVVNPCFDEGLQLPAKYLDDQANELYPYFKMLYSNPHDPHGNALGMNNVKPAPFLPLYPEEILNQCSFVVDYPDQATSTKSGQTSAGNDDDDDDYVYLADEITACYSRLQELVHGRLK